jgi:hypothetical protein
MKMTPAGVSETLVPIYHTTLRHIPEDLSYLTLVCLKQDSVLLEKLLLWLQKMR